MFGSAIARFGTNYILSYLIAQLSGTQTSETVPDAINFQNTIHVIYIYND